VAYVENNFFHPPIDTILQQLFRVRQLKSGIMTLYVCDTLSGALLRQPYNFPLMPSAIDTFLDNDLKSAFPYKGLTDAGVNFNSDCVPEERKYNTSIMSYRILKGIVTNKNKSVLHFTKILENTLVEDYNIQCKVTELNPEPNELTKAMKLLKAIKALQVKDPVPFSTDLLISSRDYSDLEQQVARKEPLNDLQKQQMWTYKCAMELWQLSDINDVDEYFYNAYIGCTEADQTAAYTTFYRILRHCDMLKKSVREHIDAANALIADTMALENSSIQVYKLHVGEYYGRLIQGHKLLMHLIGQPLVESVEIEGPLFVSLVKQYVEPLTEQEYKLVMQHFGGSFQTKDELFKDPQKVCLSVESTLMKMVLTRK
jgi:hypothetical protein